MIVVTGGAGFIGSNLVRALNRRGRSDLVVVDDLTDGRKFACGRVNGPNSVASSSTIVIWVPTTRMLLISLGSGGFSSSAVTRPSRSVKLPSTSAAVRLEPFTERNTIVMS